MGVDYGLVYICDGCGTRIETWPQIPLGNTPRKDSQMPQDWRWFKCRDENHRYTDPPKHLAYILACKACVPDAEAWKQLRQEWLDERHRAGKWYSLQNLPGIGKFISRWVQQSPEPPRCWPRATERCKL